MSESASTHTLTQASTHLIKPYFIRNRWIIAAGLLCLTLVDFLQLLIPRIIKWTIDDLTALRSTAGQLGRYALMIVAVAVLIGVFRYIWRRCLIGMSREVEEGLRNDLFDHIQGLSAAYFDRTKTGDLMAHATNDLQHIRMAAGMGLVAITDAVVLGTAAVAFMLYINVTLTLMVLIPMPMIVVSTRLFSKRMHHHYQDVQATFADLTEMVREHLAGIRIIKAYTREASAGRGMAALSKTYVDKNLKLVRVTKAFFPLMLFFSNLSLGLVLYLGGRHTIFGTITPGDFVAFISYIGLLTWPMMALGWVVNLIQRGKASLDRVDKILGTRPEIARPDSEPLLPAGRGKLQFENVSFAYSKEDDESFGNVLSGIDFDLSAGGSLGIVGPPGSGKTSLLNLLPRLYDATAGRVLVDGVDIRKMAPADLRRQIAFVPQEPFLFAGTIRANITLDDSEVAPRRLQAAVAAAALTETIASFPNGFDTVVGERGVILSGGQKQRIALARAFIRQRPILILDDPVSQVDMETGDAIIRRLRAMAGTLTIIIVSHRISAVAFTDRIMVLDDGRITELGSHDHLVAAGGYYAQTHRLQKIEEALHAF